MTNILSSLTLVYTNLAAQLLTGSADDFTKAAGLPIPPPTAPITVRVDGRRRHPSGTVTRSDYKFEFEDGYVKRVWPTGLYVDRGPRSEIIPHLLNTRPAFDTDDARAKARQILKSLGFDVDALDSTHRVYANTQYGYARIVDPGPGFPTAGRSDGRVHSRKRIYLTLKYFKRDDRESSETVISMTFLATDGRLLWFENHRLNELAKSVRMPEPLKISEAADFGPPIFIEARGEVPQSPTEKDIHAALESAWANLFERLGTNQAKCILVCDNVGNPQSVQTFFVRKASGIPWGGVYYPWAEAPFKGQERIHGNKPFPRGVQLLAITGRVELKLDLVRDVRVTAPKLENKADFVRWREQEGARVGAIAARFTRSNPPDPNRNNLFLTLSEGTSARTFEQECAKIWGRDIRFIKTGDLYRRWGQHAGTGFYFEGQIATNALVVAHIVGQLSTSTVDIQQDWNPFADRFQPSPADFIRGNLGSAFVDIVLQPDRVEAFRVGRFVDEERRTGHRMIEGYRILKRTIVKNSLLELQGSLLDTRHTYGIVKACLFEPAVAFRFWRNGESITALVCFGCNDIGLSLNDTNGKEIFSLGFDFTPVSADILKVSRRLFPNDGPLLAVDK